MSRAPGVRKADLDRAIKALADAGMGVARIEVRPGGHVVIVPGLTPPPAAGEPPAAVEDLPEDLDAWRNRKRGGRAAQGT